MIELVVLSGKGGTGKTTVSGALGYLAENKVLVDGDVDADDLHLLLSPTVKERHDFISGVKARVTQESCIGCGTCQDLCQFDAVALGTVAEIEPIHCEGCGVCGYFCPEKAIELVENHCGTWFISETKYGPLVHSQLFAGEENSGKLVAFVKTKARELAESQKLDLVLVDGPPGIGCPVIASISGSDVILLVTEPTQSGFHDLERILGLTRHFKIPCYVCINKWDLHPKITEHIEEECAAKGVKVLGKIPFDPLVVKSQINGIPVVCMQNSPAGKTIEKLWEQLQPYLKAKKECEITIQQR